MTDVESSGRNSGPPRRPPSRRSPILSAVSGVLSFVLVSAVTALIVLSWARARMRAPGPLTADKVVVIAPRTDVPDVVAELKREGVISDGLLFNVALVVEGKRSKVEAGEYLFKQSETMQGVMDAIVSGRQLLHSITIPEGLTSEQIVQRLMADDALAGDIDKIPAEGSLFPETYKFVRGASRARIIHEMQRDEEKILQEVWEQRAPDNPLKSSFELLTLASIVEKETGLPDERPHVASVFLNRLQRGMRLQSDPTVVYGLVGGKGPLGGDITHAELTQPTPYNTYLVNGLPPGPISNPGRASLEAVAHPMRTDDLYFVADGSGGHIFSATLAEHNKNVQRWRAIEKARGAPQPLIDHLSPQDPSSSGAGAVEGSPNSGVPSAPAAPRSNQRSDLTPSPSVFGALPLSLSTSRAAPGQPGGAFAKLAKMAPSLNNADVDLMVGSNAAPQAQASAEDAFAMGPTVESLGLTLAGPQGATAEALLDGPAPDPTPAQGDQNTAGSKASPPAAPIPRLPPINGHPRIIDASVGTPLDPLKNTTWDLNSPKVVPDLN